MKKRDLKPGDKVKVNIKYHGLVEGILISKSRTKTGTSWTVSVPGYISCIIPAKNITKI